MTNKEIAVSILTRHGYNIRLDAHNYSEVKNAVIRALDLADGGNLREAIKYAEPLDEELRVEVETVIKNKGSKK